jgi:hypothetical protein
MRSGRISVSGSNLARKVQADFLYHPEASYLQRPPDRGLAGSKYAESGIGRLWVNGYRVEPPASPVMSAMPRKRKQGRCCEMPCGVDRNELDVIPRSGPIGSWHGTDASADIVSSLQRGRSKRRQLRTFGIGRTTTCRRSRKGIKAQEHALGKLTDPDQMHSVGGLDPDCPNGLMVRSSSSALP